MSRVRWVIALFGVSLAVVLSSLWYSATRPPYRFMRGMSVAEIQLISAADSRLPTDTCVIFYEVKDGYEKVAAAAEAELGPPTSAWQKQPFWRFSAVSYVWVQPYAQPNPIKALVVVQTGPPTLIDRIRAKLSLWTSNPRPRR